jgi:hypothetical protein
MINYKNISERNVPKDKNIFKAINIKHLTINKFIKNGEFLPKL